MPIAGIDHIALPTADGERFLHFYERLGFRSTDEADWRAGRYPIFSVTSASVSTSVIPTTTWSSSSVTTRVPSDDFPKGDWQHDGSRTC